MAVPDTTDLRFDWRGLARTVRNSTRRMRMSGAKKEVSESFWRNRSGDEWVDTYWNADRTARRDSIISALRETFGAPSSVLDIGCNAGPTLRRIAREFPDCRLCGFDINGEAVAAAHRHLTELGLSAELSVGSFYEVLPATASKSVDIVTSSYALAYVPPAHLPGVLGDIIRIARWGAVLSEPHTLDGARSAGTLTVPWYDWRHDYAAGLVDIGISRDRIAVSDLPDPGAADAGLLVLDLR